MKGFLCFLAGLFANIGAINWGLVAFYKFNLVEYLVSMLGTPMLGPIVYGLVAASGVYGILLMVFNMCGCSNCK